MAMQVFRAGCVVRPLPEREGTLPSRLNPGLQQSPKRVLPAETGPLIVCQARFVNNYARMLILSSRYCALINCRIA